MIGICPYYQTGEPIGKDIEGFIYGRNFRERQVRDYIGQLMKLAAGPTET